MSLEIETQQSMQVTVSDAVGLPAARGSSAVAVLAQAIDDSQPLAFEDFAESVVSGRAVLALLEALVQELHVTTGPRGSAVTMCWVREAGPTG